MNPMILVVEDDRRIAALIVKNLEAAGYSCTIAGDGERVVLTTLEFDLLYFLASRPGHVFSREALMTQVWGDDRIVGDRSIDNIVSRLRKKLEADPDAPRWLQTVWGAGYRFADT